jgi:hypothetical protein
MAPVKTTVAIVATIVVAVVIIFVITVVTIFAIAVVIIFAIVIKFIVIVSVVIIKFVAIIVVIVAAAAAAIVTTVTKIALHQSQYAAIEKTRHNYSAGSRKNLYFYVRRGAYQEMSLRALDGVFAT